MFQSKQLLVALLLGALVGPAHSVEGDVLAASDFRSGTQDWTLKGLGSATGWSTEGLQSEGDVIAAIDSPSDTGRNWYYSAPKAFLGGDKTLAYNGWLVFDLGHFEYESMGLPGMDGYDVYLQAKNKKFTLGLKGVFKMDTNKLSNTYSIRLEEDFSPAESGATWELVNVVKAVDGKLVAKAPSQHEFITCLQTLTGIWIRGSYFKGSEASWLKDVKIIQGAVNKGGNPLGAVATMVNGSLVYSDKSAPPAISSTCCSSRTCVSNDKYEISFDRPGCMHSSDMYCCMSADSCSAYPVHYDKSKAAEVVRGTDYNEGRAFFTPGTVDKCYGPGKGQHGAKFSSCHTTATVDATTTFAGKPSSWNTGTKNQNMGIKSIPISKPFVKDYYMGSVPRICSPATLTIEAHGDLADAKDNIMIYGEDDIYLGTIFTGNLTYLKEGQRPYDAYGAATDCAGKYDPNVKNSGENARLADPHHPSGNRPQHKGYRGGRNDVVTPGVQGNEDTHCTTWQPGGVHPHSFQHSESVPYVDSIAISQDRMMQYSADGQIKFTFRSVRDDSADNTFSGTGGGGSTRFCNYATGANDCGTGTKCEGCDLDGKVIFRSIKLKFSAGVCYTKSAATDFNFEYFPQIHTPQNLNISVTYSVPSGESGQPGGDAAFSVTAGADIFGTDQKLVVYDKDLNKVGELFSRESFQSLRTHMSDDSMVMTTSFGAKDSPLPFHLRTTCDTTSPIVSTDKCAQPDNQWRMKSQLINYTDTLRIPRENIAKMAVNGKVQLYITADVPANAFSLSAETKARFSPITLAYPLMHCFMKAIKKGPNFGIFLDRPMSYYFKETGFPMPAGDVTVFVAASWQHHVRYVTRHVGAAVSNKFSYDGVEDGLPVMRVDKDTVADMGTVWVYKNSDGEECCPSTLRPAAADGMHLISDYSNCMGVGDCVVSTSSTNGCTEENPCASGVIVTHTAGPPAKIKSDAASTVDIDNYYVGMKMVLYVPLKAGGTANAVTFTAGANLDNGIYKLKITGGGGGGAICTVTVAGNVATATTCSALGSYQWVPTVSLYQPGEVDYPNRALGYCATGRAHAGDCTLPVLTAVLENAATQTSSLGGVTAETSLPGATAVGALEIAVDSPASTTNDKYNGQSLFITEGGVTDEYTITDYVGGTKTATVTPAVKRAYTTAGTFRIKSNVRRIVSSQGTRGAFEFYLESDFEAVPVAGTNTFRISADYEGGTTAFPRNSRDGSVATGTTAVKLASTVSCKTRVFKTGTIERYHKIDKTIRLDAEASLFDTAYNGYKIRVQQKGGAWDETTILTYAGTTAGVITVAATNTLTVTLTAANSPLITGTVKAADGTVTTGTVVQAISATNDAYNGALMEIDIDGDPSTSDDSYTRKIFDYVGAGKVISLKIPLIRKTVASGTANAGADATHIVLIDPAKAGDVGAGYDEQYKNMYILVDIDGHPSTEDDITFTQISGYVASTRIATVGAMAAAPTVHTTWTIVATLDDLDLPVATVSTFRIYNRDAVLDAVLTTVQQTDVAEDDSGTWKALAADYTAGVTEVVLVADATGNDDDYNGMKLRIYFDGVTDEYEITDYVGASKTAKVSPPLQRKYLKTASVTAPRLGAKFNIFRVYEIYEDLGTACLQNVNMTVTYTYGTARSLSNDPGELSTIYSNWDLKSMRSMSTTAMPEQRDVRSWTLKLAGAGYYDLLYPAQGLGSYDTNANKASGTQIATSASPTNYVNAVGTPAQTPYATLAITTSNAGLQVGQYVKIVKVDPAAVSEQFEVVQIAAIASATDVIIKRAQLGTVEQSFTGTLAVYTVGFNQGQGMDEMAELGGTTRYSSPFNDAYTGLWVTIVQGTGAGQTRWISDYHGDSRTVYIGGSPWSTIPDTTSKYKIWYSAEIAEFTTTGNMAIASYPRPVKAGYLVEIHWYGCSKDVPESMLNNQWTGTTTRTLGKNYVPSQARSGLSECKGQLGMRKPKEGPAVVYPRFKVLETDYVTGTLQGSPADVNGLTKGHLTLDMHARTETGFYVGRTIIIKNGATIRGTATIMQSFLGGLTSNRYTEIYLDRSIATGTAAGDVYIINPAFGISGSTTVSEEGQIGEQYTMEEVDVIRYEYPELIQQHREWPHGYSYIQMKAGEEGEHIGNLFLKDYTQYSTDSYYTDSITIPRSIFENYVKGQPNGVSGEFPFTFKTPPGKGNIELLSIVIGYPVLKEEDASSYDSTDIETTRKSSHGPPPFFPYSPGWSGVDESARTTRTHPRFQTHSYTSTCGNGVHDAKEFCDDGNLHDGDGCSSACSLEAGWICETVSLQSPSICRKGLVGSRVPDQEIGCKAYACAPPVVCTPNCATGPTVSQANVDAWYTDFRDATKNPTAVAGRAIICSGTATDGLQQWYGQDAGNNQVGPEISKGADAGGFAVNAYGPNFPICVLAGFQGTCSLCVNWDDSDSTAGLLSDSTGTSGGILVDSGVPGYDGSSKRRLLVDSEELAAASTSQETVTL